MTISPFSVLMSVYRNDKPEFFLEAVKSVSVKQTLPPDEIVIVVDGPVPESLEKAIIEIEKNIPSTRILWQKENKGLGHALNIGMKACSNELVARMDADDISVPVRFEKQIEFMENHPEIAVCGGQISEFIDSVDNIVGYRNVPFEPDDCRKYYKDRDPLNHMTVMFHKSAVMDVGNYQPWHLDEDTYLWGRLLKAGYKIANLPDILVNVRVGKEMYARRGGWKYFKSDSKILKWKLDNGFLSNGRFIYNYMVRFGVQVLMPNSLRAWIFKKLLRSK